MENSVALFHWLKTLTFSATSSLISHVVYGETQQLPHNWASIMRVWYVLHIRAATCDFQQCGILTSVDLETTKDVQSVA